MTRMAGPLAHSGRASTLPGIRARAQADADMAAAAAGVVVTEAAWDPAGEEVAATCQLFDAIWRERSEERAITPVVLRALVYAGNYVGLARCGDELVGACVGFFG